MSEKTRSLARLAHVVTTRHEARVAKLAAIQAHINRIDATIAQLRQVPVATQDTALGALGARQAWALRKEQHLLAARKALEAQAARARKEAARSHGQERAAEDLLDTARSEDRKAAERRMERQAPPFQPRPRLP